MTNRYDELEAFHGAAPISHLLSITDPFTRELFRHLLMTSRALAKQNAELARRVSDLEAGEADAHPA